MPVNAGNDSAAWVKLAKLASRTFVIPSINTDQQPVLLSSSASVRETSHAPASDSATNSVYLRQVWNTLPRLLALFDEDIVSPTYGLGDRFFWAWKLIDFPNGTFQGAAHGLARLAKHELTPEWLSQDAVLRRVDGMFRGLQRWRRANGSLEEAYPHESSFCVTSLVAFDLLSALHLLKDKLSPQTTAGYMQVIEPMIGFVCRYDEKHAFISNHLATAVAALLRWSALSADARAEHRAEALLDSILRAQSREGWFKEYEGADPGYQSLCTYYLADAHSLRPDLGLLEPLRKSLQFLWHFAHPDGSFGGIYGSRNTRFYVPAGVEALTKDVPEARVLAQHMRASIEAHRTVTLEAMDAPNLVPMFNAYCWAAAAVAEKQTPESDAESIPALPAQRTEKFRVHFHEAGLIVDNGPQHYSIVSVHKGGACCHFAADHHRASIDAGVMARSSRGKLYSSQAYDRQNRMQLNADTVVVHSYLAEVHDQLPSPIRFVILRLACLSAMRLKIINEWAKRFLVKYLITGVKRAPVQNKRTIQFGPQLKISDSLFPHRTDITKLSTTTPFSVIHMASQGYWQRQDDEQ